MALLKNEVFVCVDCESTGLDPIHDKVIEVGAIRFTLDQVLGMYESLIDPQCEIPAESMAIHHITPEMLQGKPKEHEVIQDVMQFIGRATLIGHGISFDLQLLDEAARRSGHSSSLITRPAMDTLRLARLYGQSPKNSLEALRHHFAIPPETAHRAMDDAIVNMKVFKALVKQFRTTEQVFKALEQPILMRAMPLGKHKGRPFKEVPISYLRWAAHQDFDQDLRFSIRTELKKRDRGGQFRQATNPFQALE